MFRKFEKYMLRNGNIRKEFKLFGRKTIFNWESPGGFSRFGGGWDIECGIQFGGSSIIINLFFCYFRIYWR